MLSCSNIGVHKVAQVLESAYSSQKVELVSQLTVAWPKVIKRFTCPVMAMMLANSLREQAAPSHDTAMVGSVIELMRLALRQSSRIGTKEEQACR